MSDNQRAIQVISRQWNSYLVKAVFAEPTIADATKWPERTEDEIRAFSSTKSEFECQLFVLPTPIVKADNVLDVISVTDGAKQIRFYPPFRLNEKAETSGAFSEVLIPDGLTRVERLRPIPDHAVRGVRSEHQPPPRTSWCRGLRADVEPGANVGEAINLLLDHICQNTNQWWLRGTHNPFLGVKRLGANLDRQFRPLELHEYRGARKIESPWYGAVEFQPSLGTIAPLSNENWLSIANYVSKKMPADGAVIGLRDAYADYMAGRDEKCILGLCIAVEIALSKHWQLILKKTAVEKIDKLIRLTPLADGKTKEELKYLLVDRNHVAHGRAPHILASDKGYTLERYIAAVDRLIGAYLQSIPSDAWPDIMISRPARRHR
jgi:hypothetical protein